MKRILYLMFVLLFLNGCSYKLASKISKAEQETIFLSEYTGAAYKNGNLYLDYVGRDSIDGVSQPLVAEYNLNAYSDEEKQKPIVLESSSFNRDGTIDIPIHYIDIQTINVTECRRNDEALYQALFNSFDINSLKTPCIYIIYEMSGPQKNMTPKYNNRSMFLFIWSDQGTSSKSIQHSILNTPNIKVSNTFKIYALKSLWPFALVADIPAGIVFLLFMIFDDRWYH